MKIVIVTRENGKPELVFARELVDSLLAEKHYVEVNPNRWNHLQDADLVVSVGGDGTLLRTVSQMKKQIPIIGVNFGGVGFLTDLEPSNAIEKIREIANKGNQIKIEKRMRIDVLHNGKVIGTALNDIAFKAGDYSVKFSASIDGVIATEFKGDGLLVSTPTGSTAYALSAGGPITDPKINSFLLIPIAPYLLSSRPQVIHGSRCLTVTTDEGRVIIDGQSTWVNCLGVHQTFEFKVSENPALFVDVGRNFFEKVNTKLKRL
jgi:NAD+ kinase